MTHSNHPRTLQARLAARFATLRWRLASLPERLKATRHGPLVNRRAAATRFPISALRYWWTRCALLEETEHRGAGVVIADLGCNNGQMRRFVGDVPEATWIGLDQHIDAAPLRAHGYDDLHECDFDRPLPLADDSVDIVVFLHVLEHLPRPAFTLVELSRILRPGGLLVAGSPVAPAPVARLRQWHHRSRLARGPVKPGGHINALDCRRWRTLLADSGMTVEMMTGTFLARWSGNPLENHAWWVRLNQAWGALFPSLGGEVYLSARFAPLRLD